MDLSTLIQESHMGREANEASIGFPRAEGENTCYRNVALEMLLHLPPVIKWAHQALEKHDCGILCICCFFYQLLNDYWYGDPAKKEWIASLNNVWGEIKEAYPEHTENEEGDVLQLLEQILRYMNFTLNGEQINPDADDTIPDPSGLFHAQMLDTRVCQTCLKETQKSYFQSLRGAPLPEVKGGPKKGERLTVDDALVRIVTEENVERECKTCKKNTEHKQNTKISQLPEVLVVQVYRFPGGFKKNRYPLTVDDSLTFPPSLCVEGIGAKYALCGAVFHLGAKINTGHFTAALVQQDLGWMHISDDICNRYEDFDAVVKDTSRKEDVYNLVYTRVADGEQAAEEVPKEPEKNTKKRKRDENEGQEAPGVPAFDLVAVKDGRRVKIQIRMRFEDTKEIFQGSGSLLQTRAKLKSAPPAPGAGGGGGNDDNDDDDDDDDDDGPGDNPAAADKPDEAPAGGPSVDGPAAKPVAAKPPTDKEMAEKLNMLKRIPIVHKTIPITEMPTIADLYTQGRLSEMENPRNAPSQQLNDIITVGTFDITKLNIDAIVNAAKEPLTGGAGIDGAIHRAAGKELLVECKKVGPCPTGEARITDAYQLPAKTIIHTVGPQPKVHGDECEALLRSCYRRTLELAVINGVRSVAFPSISTGIYGYPVKKAAHEALSEVRSFLEEPGHAENFDRIIFSTIEASKTKLYLDLIPTYFPPPAAE